MLLPLLLLVLFSVTCVSASSSSLPYNNASSRIIPCMDKERLALLSFRAGLTDSYHFLASWSNTTDCCKWSGVECSTQTGHVIALYLSSYGLAGKISPSLLELQELTSLDLSFIDFESRPIPKFMGSFTKLKHLALVGCNLSGVIPSQLGNLSNLNFLDLSYNHLEGMIPTSFGNLSNLVDLDMSVNSLSGNLSDFLDILSRPGCASTLERLYVGRNKLYGPLPDGIIRFSSLRELYLSRNQLNGTLSKNLGTLSQLQYLYLSSNSFTGTISEAHFSNLSRLIDLDLSHNALHIKVSPKWSPHFQLSFIGLRSCNLGPLFPNWIRTQKNFEMGCQWLRKAVREQMLSQVLGNTSGNTKARKSTHTQRHKQLLKEILQRK